MSTKSYPRIEELGLAVSQRGFWITAESKRPDCSVNADQLEALLESAPVVCAYMGPASRPGGMWIPEANKDADSTHSARLIAIKPIVKESAEDLLREIVKRAYIDSQKQIRGVDDLINRARRLLEREDNANSKTQSIL